MVLINYSIVFLSLTNNEAKGMHHNVAITLDGYMRVRLNTWSDLTMV